MPVKLGRPITTLPEGVVKSSKSPCSVASPRKAAVVSYDALRSGEGFDEMPERLKGLYPPSKVCPKSSVKRKTVIAKQTHHVVSYELKMPAIDVNIVHSKHASDFPQDGSASHLHPVGLQNGVNVIRIKVVIL